MIFFNIFYSAILGPCASAPADPGQLHTKPQAQGASFWSQLKGPAALGPFHTVLPPPFWYLAVFFWYCGTCVRAANLLFCFVLFALQLSVCLWWHDYRRDGFPTLKFGVVMAALLAIRRERSPLH